MLTCVYHPIDPMQVVEEEEAMRMKASGVWFDSPADARQYKERVEADIKKESEPKQKPKQKGKSDER